MNDEAARRLGQLLREASSTQGSRKVSEPELARLLRSVDMLGQTRRGRVRPWLFVAAALVMVALVLVSASMLVRRDLTYQVRGAARIADRSMSADAGEPVQVQFSDGSNFELSPGGRLRIESSTPDGARIALLDGAATASVVHRSGAHWSVTAGPFEVTVIGTRFNARWDQIKKRLSVELQDGAVEVKGGSLSTPLVVRAGQRLEAGTAHDDWRLTSLSSKAQAPAPVASASAAAGALDVPVPEPLQSPAVSSAPSWQKLMSQSQFDVIVEQAQSMGVERCFSHCTPVNLRILADAARYTGKFDLAEKSLLALKRRSPQHSAAAAFFLGRLYESNGRTSEALRMYELHLAEAPRGDYAEQAMGARMRILARGQDAQRAKQAAESYLRQYPNGVHADAARRVLGAGKRP